MKKIRSATLAAVFSIMWLGACLIHPALAENSAVSIVTANPAGKAAGFATTAGALPGGPTTKPAVRPAIEPGTYVVRTIWKGAPLPMVRVEWRHQVEDGAPTLSGNTIRFGTANFRPVTGSYFLTADWRPDNDFKRPRKPGDRFAWLGGNPLLVSSKIGGEITLTLEEVPALPATSSSGTGIHGRVTRGGMPSANVGIYAYEKTASGFKGNDFNSHINSNAQGEFTLDLPPGRYYLVARLRTDSSVDLGPLHKGDLFGYDPRNPIIVEAGNIAAAAIPITTLKMLKMPGESSTFKPGIIQGLILDREGHPVPGVHAALYVNPKMADRPAYRSEPVGADGRFQLTVPIPGSYFLGARSGYGGAPAAGGWTGAWNGSTDHSISIKSGEVRTGVEIIVDRLGSGVNE